MNFYLPYMTDLEIESFFCCQHCLLGNPSLHSIVFVLVLVCFIRYSTVNQLLRITHKAKPPTTVAMNVSILPLMVRAAAPSNRCVEVVELGDAPESRS